jgi:acid phosphatase
MHRSHSKLIFTLLALMTLVAGVSVAQVPRSKHVYVVAEENHSYEHMVGSPYMPYFNSLIAKGGLATQFYADMHGSLENYLILASGQYLTRNNETTTVFTVDNIERHLLTNGMTFKSYAESLPYAGFTGLYSGSYVKRHAPLPYFGEMAHSTLIKDHVSTNMLASDIANGNLPNFGFITPNLLHDIHNCPNGLNACLQTADSWLKTHIAPLLARPEFQPGGDGLLIIWADEADLSTDNRCSATVKTGCGGHIPVILIGPQVKAGFKSTKNYHHSSVLRTILEMMGTTANFPAKAETAPDMAEFFKGSSSSSPVTGSVKISAPTTSTVAGPAVHLAASASGPHTITAMRVYVDNVSKDFVHAASVDTQLSMTSGTHHVVFQAWDSTGAVFKASKTITVQ